MSRTVSLATALQRARVLVRPIVKLVVARNKAGKGAIIRRVKKLIKTHAQPDELLTLGTLHLHYNVERTLETNGFQLDDFEEDNFLEWLAIQRPVYEKVFNDYLGNPEVAVDDDSTPKSDSGADSEGEEASDPDDPKGEANEEGNDPLFF